MILFFVQPCLLFSVMNSLMSLTLQTVTRSDSFIGFGKRPALTPAHQADLEMGMMGGMGGIAFGLPTIWATRRNPISGIFVMV